MPTGIESFAPSLDRAGWVAKWLSRDNDGDGMPRVDFDWDSRTIAFTNLLRPRTFWPKKTIRHRTISFDDHLDVYVIYQDGTNYLVVRTCGAECAFTRKFWKYEDLRDRFALIREIVAFTGPTPSDLKKQAAIWAAIVICVAGAAMWYLSTI